MIVLKKFFSVSFVIFSTLTFSLPGGLLAAEKTEVVTPQATDDPTYPDTEIKIYTHF